MRRRIRHIAAYIGCAAAGIGLVALGAQLKTDWYAIYLIGLFISWVIATNVTRLR